MTGAKIIQSTLASVLAELERLDPASLIAARARGVLDMAGNAASAARVRQAAADEAIVATYVAGASAYECAAQHGVGTSTVYNVLRRMGVSARLPGAKQGTTRPQDAERLARMVALRDDGKSLSEIGVAEKITRERVRQLFIKAGLSTDPLTKPQTPEEKAAVARYVEGDSIDTCAVALGVCNLTFRHVLSRAGVAVRPSKKAGKRSAKTIADAERAAQMYRAGVRTADIATALGVGKPSQIYRLLSIAGVERNRQPRDHLRLTPADTRTAA